MKCQLAFHVSLKELRKYRGDSGRAEEKRRAWESERAEEWRWAWEGVQRGGSVTRSGGWNEKCRTAQLENARGVNSSLPQKEDMANPGINSSSRGSF
jgi:hypothetical protein